MFSGESRKIIFATLFYSFLKNYNTTASYILRETIFMFKPCRFNVNLWTLCFVLQKVPKPFKSSWERDYLKAVDTIGNNSKYLSS